MTRTRNQGEGDRESARRFNERSQKFVKSEQGREVAKNADHRGRNSSKDLVKAERDAASRAKEQDLETVRDYSKPAKK
jgi:hypothetical protein